MSNKQNSLNENNNINNNINNNTNQNDDLRMLTITIKEILNLFSNKTLFDNYSINNDNSSNNNEYIKDGDENNLQTQLIIEKFENLLKQVKSNINLVKDEISIDYVQLYELITKIINRYLYITEIQQQLNSSDSSNNNINNNDKTIFLQCIQLIHMLC